MTMHLAVRPRRWKPRHRQDESAPERESSPLLSGLNPLEIVAAWLVVVAMVLILALSSVPWYLI